MISLVNTIAESVEVSCRIIDIVDCTFESSPRPISSHVGLYIDSGIVYNIFKRKRTRVYPRRISEQKKPSVWAILRAQAQSRLVGFWWCLAEL